MAPVVLRAAQLPISPWPNNAGRKADIASGPGWLVAFAWLDQDARFSDYTGVDRTITLIDGDGFVLRFDDGRDLAVMPFSPTDFDGGVGLSCHLPHGTCRVLNVMTDRRHASHRVQIGACDGNWDQGGPTVFVALEEDATLHCPGQSFALGRLDSVVFEATVDIRTTGRFALFDITPV